MLRGSRGFAPHCTAPLRAGRRKPCVCRLFCAPTRRHKAFARRTAPCPIPPPRAGRRQLRSHRRDRSEGARHAGRYLSPAPSALAKPVVGRPAQHPSQRRSATSFRHQRRECPLAREKPRKTGRKEQKAGSFRRKMRRKSRQTRGILQTVCGIRSAHKPTPVLRSRRQEKTVRPLPSEEEGGPIFIGTLRTTAADSRERLGDDCAKTGVSKPIRLSPLYSARGQREATRQCRPHTACKREFVSLSAPPSPRLLPAVRDRCRAPPPYPWRQ